MRTRRIQLLLTAGAAATAIAMLAGRRQAAADPDSAPADQANKQLADLGMIRWRAEVDLEWTQTKRATHEQYDEHYQTHLVVVQYGNAPWAPALDLQEDAAFYPERTATGAGSFRLHAASDASCGAKTTDVSATRTPKAATATVEFHWDPSRSKRPWRVAAEVHFEGTDHATNVDCGTTSKSTVTNGGDPSIQLDPDTPGVKLTHVGDVFTIDGKVTSSTSNITEVAVAHIVIRPDRRPKPDVLVIDEPRDYDRWLPQPISTDPKIVALFGKGRPVTFHIHLDTAEGKPEIDGQTIELYLHDASRQKGIAVNYPKANADTGPDLKFSAPDPARGINVGLAIDPRDPTHATAPPSTAYDVTIEATDTGAYGKLSAEAPAIGAHSIDSRTHESYAAVPEDDDGNHIADGWQAREGVGHLPADWDQDAVPAEIATAGDGLSLYDEYRGFVVEDPHDGKRAWTRLAPLRRKLFVLRAGTHAGWMWEGAQLFEKISNIRVYYVPGDDFVQDDGAHRSFASWINFNSDAPKAYIERLVESSRYDCEPAKGDFVYGQTFGLGGCQAIPKGPWQVLRIAIFPSTMKRLVDTRARQYREIVEGSHAYPQTEAMFAKLGVTAEEVVRNIGLNAGELEHELYVFTVAHEMFHGIGAWHHDPIDGPSEACPLFYWGDRYGPAFLVGRFHPNQTAWVGSGDSKVDPGHAAPWQLDAQTWQQLALRP